MPFRAKTLQITWHAKSGCKNDPLLSIDFHPTLPLFATAGSDNEIKVWRLHEQQAAVNVEYLFTLQGHMKTVNTVRFSPNGECLASVSDDAVCAIWRPNSGASWASVTTDKHIARVYLRRHTDDVYDVAWSPDSRHIITGSVDNTAIVWDVARARDVAILTGHSQFVQGVSWDPSGQYLVTQSNDRTVRIFLQKGVGLRQAPKGKAAKAASSAAQPPPPTFQCIQVIRSREVAAEAGAGAGASASASASASAAEGAEPSAKPPAPWKHHLYGDETVPSFFRRPAWSPDATLLFTPTGHFRASPSHGARPTTYAFSPALGFAEPVAHFPVATTAKPSVAVRVSPILYRLRSAGTGAGAGAGAGAGSGDGSSSAGFAVGSPNPAFALPYRMLVAVATLDAVVVYDTECAYPVAAVANMHYDKITDLAWSPSGRVLLLTSIDGYCSMLQFDEGDVGERLPLEQHPPLMLYRRHGPTYPPSKPSKSKAAAVAAAAAAGAGAGAGADENGGVAAAAPPLAPAPVKTVGGKRKLEATLLTVEGADIPAASEQGAGEAGAGAGAGAEAGAGAGAEAGAGAGAAAGPAEAAPSASGAREMQEEAPPPLPAPQQQLLSGDIFGGGGALASILANVSGR